MATTRIRQEVRRSFAALVAALFVAGSALLLFLQPTLSGRELPRRRGVETITFYALDYQRTSYDFLERSFVHGFQIDERYRDFPGDVHFDGHRLALVEDNLWTGVMLDLGRDTQPDNEYSTFYGLTTSRRRFHLREFPYQDQTVPYDGVNADAFFGRLAEPNLSARLELGHTYAIRITHRTRLGFERAYLLRVIDLTPGVKATVIWRELPIDSGPLERLPPRTNRGDIRGR